MQINKIKNKKLVFFSKCILFICSILFFSCASNSISSDNKNLEAIQNIYIEYQNIADTFVTQEKYDKAINYYKLALENKDTYWNVYYKLAKTYVLQKSWADAEPMFKTLLKRDPSNSNIKISLAYVYSLNGSLEEAKEIYKELIEIYPEVKDYLENYISILIVEEKFEDMIISFDLLKEKFPDSDKISIFDKEYEKYITKQKELYPEKYIDSEDNKDIDDESTQSGIVEINTAHNNESINKNPEESNLEIEDIDD